MKSRQVIIALVLAATGSLALAQDVSAQSTQPQGKTRAQVIEELKQARAAGLVSSGDYDYPKLAPFVSTKTRAQVIDELKQAQARGEVNVGDANYPYTPEFVSTRTRAEVQAEQERYANNPDPQGLYRGY
ncbi:DUF4148 domain-containing protein [Herbaspirillum sp. YR522]|uniref:DUF4148 domain-containing protein n=1 Tax=Herbaspirillum sp. YR522 TaxID=1144342 RepID=UPI00026FB38A|nr:DUF4148 domain-containing protein [Herbaspirillum sp. YR522]EJN06030.1 hypothetical protein PMI40_02318 [Herbaspirillum sp. YR522]